MPNNAKEYQDDDNADDDININEVLGTCIAQTSDPTQRWDDDRYSDTRPSP